MMLPDSMEATQDRVPTSWVERVSRAELPMRLISSKRMVFTLRKTPCRRSAQKPATTLELMYQPPSTEPRLTRATTSIFAQQRKM